jgi:hypothetical protein
MLMIRDTADLKKYLETRKKMVENQIVITLNGPKIPNDRVNGMIYAFDEAIKAVDALLESEKISESAERR